MSTHLFQIGDIVRINQPTLKQWAEIRTRGFHPVEISPYIGYLAVVVETWNSGEDVSDAFDPSGPFDGADIPTIGGHLILVQASPLRAMRIGQGAPDGLSGHPLPMAGSNLQRDVIAPECDAVLSGTVPNGSIVEALRLSHRRNSHMELYVDCRVTLYENDRESEDTSCAFSDGDGVIVPIPTSAFLPGFTTF